MTERRNMAVDPPIPEAEAEAIASVARVAAESVAKRQIKKLVIGCTVGAFLAATAVNIPVSNLISKSNSHNNCTAITDLASVEASAYEKQVARTVKFQKESKDTFGLPRAQFEKLIQGGHEDELGKLKVFQRIASRTCA